MKERISNGLVEVTPCTESPVIVSMLCYDYFFVILLCPIKSYLACFYL